MSVAEARAITLSEILKTTAKELDMLNADLLFIRQLQSDSLRKVAKEDPKKFSLIANANCRVFPSSQELEASSCFKFSKTLRALRLSRSIARIREVIFSLRMRRADTLPLNL
ncbi:MAG TPA: hypothetical protein VFR08_13705 [Candidatus Angelobacter sp.]|nr:hypothetical protein [Candidatus Angelobacter sp.]